MTTRREPFFTEGAKPFFIAAALILAGGVFIASGSALTALLGLAYVLSFPLVWLLIALAVWIVVAALGAGDEPTEADAVAWLFPAGLIWGLFIAMMLLR